MTVNIKGENVCVEKCPGGMSEGKRPGECP